MAQISALLDTCVLFPRTLCQTLQAAARHGLYRMQLSEGILAELHPKLTDPRKVKHPYTEERADEYIAMLEQLCLEPPIVTHQECEDLMCNDVKDHHVLAAAIKAGVNVVVTSNLKDFPEDSLKCFKLEVWHPDYFLDYLRDHYGSSKLHEVVRTQSPHLTEFDVLKKLSKQSGKQALPLFINNMLLHIFADMVEESAREVLKCFHSEVRDNCYQGEQYSICRASNALSIVEIDTRRTVLKSSRDGYAGNLTIDDTEKFQQILNTLRNR